MNSLEIKTDLLIDNALTPESEMRWDNQEFYSMETKDEQKQKMYTSE